MRARTALVALATAPLLATPALAIAADGGSPLSTDLTGAEEAPSPGDPDATGLADLRLNQGQGRVCFDISWADVEGEVFAAHIHKGAPGVAGPIVITLFTGSFSGTDSVSGCGEADPEDVKAIRKNATEYYVNVHSTPDFPGGAVRGQLGD